MSTTPRYQVVDRWATTASHLRPKSTSVNPRYLVQNVETREFVDEFTTKRAAELTVRDLNAFERANDRMPKIVVVDAPDVSPCCGAPTSVDEHAVVYCKRCYAAI